MLEYELEPTPQRPEYVNSQALNPVQPYQYEQSSRRRNAIINGDFQIWQRGTSFTSIANGAYSADRWLYTKSGAMVHDITRDTDAPAVADAGRLFNHCLKIACTTADASLAGTDVCTIEQRIEGYTCVPLVQRPLTFSFWIKSTKTGPHCISIRNSGSNRGILLPYDIYQSDVWEKKIISIPPTPADGTWGYTDGTTLFVVFALAVGANFQDSTTNQWYTLSGNDFGTSTTVNDCDSTSNVVKLTAIQLEANRFATEFDDRTFPEELMLSKRYYQTGSADIYISGPNMSSATLTEHRQHVMFPVSMRATPTMTYSGESTGFTAGAVNSYINGFTVELSHSGTADFRPKFNWTANAEL